MTNKEKYLELLIFFLRNRKGNEPKIRFLTEPHTESLFDELLALQNHTPEKYDIGIPIFVETMTYEANLRFILEKCKYIIDNKIKGDIVETGVWRGGCILFMKLIFNTYNDSYNRSFFVCDSFEGCPPPTVYMNTESEYKDEGDNHYTIKELAVSVEEVIENFRKYNALDDSVKFRKGWFHETMPNISKEIENISILRLDGDLYISTKPVLDELYDKVSIGGVIMLDDIGLKGFDTALDEFRIRRNITTPIIKVEDSHNVCYWIKE